MAAAARRGRGRGVAKAAVTSRPAAVRPSTRFTATSREVAQLAGVSRSAVSRAFTPDASVSESTRRKVLAAAERLGYQPNVIARSLITDRSRLVGLVMGELDNPFYAAMLRSFSEKLQRRDYQVMLLTTAADGSVDGAVRRLMQYRADGIILVSCEPDAALARGCVQSGTRLVIVNREAEGLPGTKVLTDGAGIGRLVAQRLLRAGYRRLGLVRGDPVASTVSARNEAFKAEIAASGTARVVLDQTHVVGYAAGRRFVQEARQREPELDAIFCASDLCAFGVLDGARLDLGLSVPDELAVVGVGDVQAASWAPYELTTVRLPVEGLVDASISALLDDAPGGRRTPVVVGADMVERKSVRLMRDAR